MFTTVVRTVILYFLVIFAIRIMGKRQIGDMQPGELVITILISEIAAIPIQDLSQPIATGIVAVFTLVFLEIAVSVVAMKFLPLRRVFYGDSAIVIKDGTIDQTALKKLRVTAPDLLEVLRNQNVFDVTTVAYAILETNGQLSVMLKPEFQPATAADVNIEKGHCSFPYLVISDGKLISDSIIEAGQTKSGVRNFVSRSGLKIKDIFIMTCDSKNNFTVIKKENKK